MRKIAVSQRVEAAAKGAERRDCLDQRWTTVLSTLGLAAVPMPNTLADPQDFIESVGAAGLILSGGNDLLEAPGARTPAPERDATERAALAHCLGRHLPVLGVCRGMQAINVFLGGQLEAVSGHAGTRHTVATVAANAFGWPAQFEVNSYHDYFIPRTRLAPLLEPLAATAEGGVEAFRHRSLQCVGIMWHPERETPVTERDMDLLRRLFS
jgi:N5-(cytidine 5'-diphosphoramidyl)-L-glutamine hydrolase